MKATMTYEIAMACAKDAANRKMRAAGRKGWDVDDYNQMCDTFDRLWPEDRPMPEPRRERDAVE